MTLNLLTPINWVPINWVSINWLVGNHLLFLIITMSWRERERKFWIHFNIFILINVKYKEISWKERKERYIFCVINVKYKDISWRVRRRKRKKVTHRVNSCYKIANHSCIKPKHVSLQGSNYFCQFILLKLRNIW